MKSIAFLLVLAVATMCAACTGSSSDEADPSTAGSNLTQESDTEETPGRDPNNTPDEVNNAIEIVAPEQNDMNDKELADGEFRIEPIRDIEELRTEALAATPPEEVGSFRASELVELTSLDPTIRLDVRYATDNNFMGSRMYQQGRAFLQRPAAEALVRVHQGLSDRDLGLIIYDGYRPWYVTKMFWEATPPDLRTFVANPASGSRHNRGCAVDLGLLNRTTDEVLPMPSGYDEFSDRAYSDYSGGTDEQRRNRSILREAMEAKGFVVNPTEWWHFDYEDWRDYRIQNKLFAELN